MIDYYFIPVILCVVAFLMCFSFRLEDRSFAILAGFLLLCMGLYFVINGVDYADPDIPQINHAEMWNYTSNATAWDFDFPEGSGVYHNLSNLSASTHLDKFTFTGATQAEGGSYLTTGVGGDFKVSFSVSCSSDSNKALYGFLLAKNFDPETARECYARTTFTEKNKVRAVSSSCFLFLEPGDTLSLLIDNEENEAGLNIHTVNVNALKVGD